MSDAEFITEQTACVIMETVQGDAGVRIPDKSYLQAVRQRCTETGTLFAFEQFDIVPDILTLAKAFGGGLPIGAFISDKKIMETLACRPMLGHITTFGGNPVCCAAALAALEATEEEKLLESVEKKGLLMASLLMHPRIKALRRIGLMFALDFENAVQVNHI